MPVASGKNFMSSFTESPSAFIISGGDTVFTSGGYTYIYFTNVGTTNISITGNGDIDYWIVGGGGSGGACYGGGGGGAGIVTGSAFMYRGTTSVTVGSGGNGSYDPGTLTANCSGQDGGYSFVGSLSAAGGGVGGSRGGIFYEGGFDSNGGRWDFAGNNLGIGGCGGGVGSPSVDVLVTGARGTNGQRGGDSATSAAAGGGGGYSTEGSDATGVDFGGDGGDGVTITIAPGISLSCCGGGGGGVDSSQPRYGNGGAGGGGRGGYASSGPVAGSVNTGGGGGGGGRWAGEGANGGSGIVIIRYIPR